MHPIRLLIVDDHPVVREGLRIGLGNHDDFEIAGEAADGPSAIAEYARLRPDVVLLDMRLPGMEGPEVITAIRQLDPQARIIVLTSYDIWADAERAVEAGASGFLLKVATGQEIMDAIRKVHAGNTALNSGLFRQMRPAEGVTRLTLREIEVLELMVQGHRNNEIAAHLGLSLNTVKFHLKQIMEKLGSVDRTEAAMIAVRDGVVRL